MDKPVSREVVMSELQKAKNILAETEKKLAAEEIAAEDLENLMSIFGEIGQGMGSW